MKNIFCILFLSIASLAAAFSPSDCKLAENAIIRYIKLDTAGETTHTSKQVDDLVYYNGRDTAGYDSMTIVSSSEIQDCKKKNLGLELRVKYKIFGLLAGNSTKKDLDVVLTSKPKEITESFYMVKDGES